MKSDISDPQNEISTCCVKWQLLEANPHHFGIESAINTYVKEVRHMKVYACYVPETNQCVGFAALEEHSKDSGEIYVIAVHPDVQRQGWGTLLMDCCLYQMRRKGMKYLLVKTLSDRHPDAYYAETRMFYRQYGFAEGETFLDLWGESNPCLQMIYQV